MQIISVEINQHKISMKELCSKVPASSAALGLVGGRAEDGSFWGGGAMHHLFPLLVGITVEESTTTVHSHHLFKSSLLIFHILMKFHAYHCPQGSTFIHRHFFLCCKAPGPPLFVQSFSLRAISTLAPIMLLPLWRHCRQESGKRLVLNIIVKIYSFEIKHYFFIVLSLPLCLEQCLNQSRKDQIPNQQIVSSFWLVFCCLYINYSIVMSNLKLKSSEQWVTLILISE